MTDKSPNFRYISLSPSYVVQPLLHSLFTCALPLTSVVACSIVSLLFTFAHYACIGALLLSHASCSSCLASILFCYSNCIGGTLVGLSLSDSY